MDKLDVKYFEDVERVNSLAAAKSNFKCGLNVLHLISILDTIERFNMDYILASVTLGVEEKYQQLLDDINNGVFSGLYTQTIGSLIRFLNAKLNEIYKADKDFLTDTDLALYTTIVDRQLSYNNEHFMGLNVIDYIYSKKPNNSVTKEDLVNNMKMHSFMRTLSYDATKGLKLSYEKEATN